MPDSVEIPSRPPVAQAGLPKPAATTEHSTQSKPPQAVSVAKVTPPAKSPALHDVSPSPAQENDEKWPKPQSLYAQLAGLDGEPQTRDWASSVEKLVHRLGPALSQGGAEAVALAAKLEQLGEQGTDLASQLDDHGVAAKLRRAVYSLDRRLAIWKPIAEAGGIKANPPETGDEDLQELEACLGNVDAMLENSSEGPGWARFLELDKLHQLVADGATPRDGRVRALARKVLDRVSRVSMMAAQRRFLARGPLAALDRQLRRLAAAPVAYETVLRHIEKFEEAPTPYDARILAEDCEQLAYCKAAPERAIGQGLEGYYRNANLRVVVAVDLLNRFIPERAKEYGDVHDVVGGQPVYGRSLTATRARLRCIPDPEQVHVALDVNGQVAASTHSVSGPATFYNDSQSVYRGWKEIEIGTEGMVIHPAQVAVNNALKLRGLSTDFDDIPLIGTLAQEVARSQLEQKRGAMSSEVEQKIAARARVQIDQEAEDRLGVAAHRVRSAVLDPLAELSLGPTLVGAETTDRRVAMRLRLACDRQLGGYTPRPQAPSDSVVSFQVHESALNNVLEQLQLDGATFTLPQLRERIASRLKRGDLFRGDTENDDVTIAFAPHNAVHVACRDGKLLLTLAVARLAKPPYAWDDFQVRVFLRPKVEGRMIQLVREDLIQLKGRRLGLRAQIALRGVFSQTFSKNRPIAAMPEAIVNEPRLQDLVFTQLVIEDGWIGGALGPGRVARNVLQGDEIQTRRN